MSRSGRVLVGLALWAVAIMGAAACNPESLRYLGAAARVASQADACLRALLAAEAAKCEQSSDREACLADAEQRVAQLASDIQAVRSLACEEGQMPAEFAGVCP